MREIIDIYKQGLNHIFVQFEFTEREMMALHKIQTEGKENIWQSMHPVRCPPHGVIFIKSPATSEKTSTVSGKLSLSLAHFYHGVLFRFFDDLTFQEFKDTCLNAIIQTFKRPLEIMLPKVPLEVEDSVYIVSSVFHPEMESEVVLENLRHDLNQYEASRGKPPRVAETDAKIERQDTTIRLYLNLSESDRAIVHEFGLDEIAYEDDPLYTPVELEDKRRAFEKEAELISDINKKTELILLHAEMLKAFQARRIQRKLPDYLHYPYERSFATRHEATEYCDKMERIIRKIHGDIESYKTKVRAGVVTFRP